MIDVHSFIGNRSMGTLAISKLRRSQLLNLPLILLFVELLPLLNGDDVFPIHVILHVAYGSELSEEAFATE
jgi:hypothetical protein